MNYVICPIIHGVQLKEINDDFAKKFVDGIKSYLTDSEKNYFIPLAYNWSHTTNPRQLEMYHKVESGLRHQKLRKLKHTAGSDVTWTFRSKKGSGSFYDDFVFTLDSLLDSSKKSYAKSKIMLIGHSQGSQLAFNYIWDTNYHVQGLAFMGSPFTMNSGAFDDWGDIPKGLDGFWLNFYNRRDFISSKIQDCHPRESIAKTVEDYEVPLGWNPLNWTIAGSHTLYWKSDFVHQMIADRIRKLIKTK